MLQQKVLSSEFVEHLLAKKAVTYRQIYIPAISIIILLASCYYSAVHLDHKNIIKLISPYCNQENTRWIKLPGHPYRNSS